MWQLIKSMFCRHKGDTVQASCPVTGLTYTYCVKCSGKTKVEKTNA